MIFITKYPFRSIETGILSRWTCLFNPIIYEMQRKDLSVSVINDTNLIQLNVNSTEIAVGESIYLKSGNYSDVYVISEVVDSNKFRVTGGNWLQTFGGYVNLISHRKSYKVQIDVYDMIATEIIGSLKRSPDNTGLLKADVAEQIKGMLNVVNDFDYVTTNKKDTNHFGKVNIALTEIWTDSISGVETTVSYSIDANGLIYWVNAVKQVGDINGQNLLEFVPYRSTHIGSVATNAKFLSGFDTPTLFKGFPFMLSFLYSENISDKLAKQVLTKLNINDGIISTVKTNLDDTQSVALNRMAIITPDETNCKKIQVYIENDTATDIYNEYVNDYVADYFEQNAYQS